LWRTQADRVAALVKAQHDTFLQKTSTAAPEVTFTTLSDVVEEVALELQPRLTQAANITVIVRASMMVLFYKVVIGSAWRKPLPHEMCTFLALLSLRKKRRCCNYGVQPWPWSAIIWLQRRLGLYLPVHLQLYVTVIGWAHPLSVLYEPLCKYWYFGESWRVEDDTCDAAKTRRLCDGGYLVLNDDIVVDLRQLEDTKLYVHCKGRGVDSDSDISCDSEHDSTETSDGSGVGKECCDDHELLTDYPHSFVHMLTHESLFEDAMNYWCRRGECVVEYGFNHVHVRR
jgi:hypothetical protein